MLSCEQEKSTDLKKHLNFLLKSYFRNFDFFVKTGPFGPAWTTDVVNCK